MEHNPKDTPKEPLPPIPAKRYFTIGEVSELCGVKPHVLRYWEQEFTQLKPVKRRGNRRYYQHHEVLLVRRIRELLYSQGFRLGGQPISADYPRYDCHWVRAERYPTELTIASNRHTLHLDWRNRTRTETERH